MTLEERRLEVWIITFVRHGGGRLDLKVALSEFLIVELLKWNGTCCCIRFVALEGHVGDQ